MYTWISQRRFSSRTARTVERTRYLESLRGDLERAIRHYFERDPRGEQVTLACLAAVGKEEAQNIARHNGRTLDGVKQDIGLYVAILLGDLFQLEGVETYRDGKTLRNATRSRPPRWNELAWVSKYTPHRLNPKVWAAKADRVQTPVRIVEKEDDRDALRFWLAQPPEARINAMEFLRRQVFLVTGRKTLPHLAHAIRLRDAYA
ncbi:MAG: hypothetical protein NTY77_14055 [Elusimicrobia bacterium]|nr:hypothetical protein [Elusimicrobiota bacterium]